MAEQTLTQAGDLLTASVLSQMVQEALVDRADLRPLIKYFGSVSGRGSNVLKVGVAAFDDAMAAANTDEVTGIGDTVLGDASANITVARQALMRTVTDLYDTAISPGYPGYQAFADDMARAYVLRITDMACALFTSATGSKGTSGQPLTVDDVYDAAAVLRSAAIGGEQIHCVLHPVQYSHFIESLRGEGQSVVDPNSPEMLKLKSYGFQGVWNNINFWSCDSVNASSSDKVGCMFVDGFLGMADGIPSPVRDQVSWAHVSPLESPVFVEFQRDAAKGQSLIVGNAYVGVSVIEAARACKLVTVGTL